MKFLVSKLKKITAPKCLAVLFLCFCFWVGSHTFIPFLENTISVVKMGGSLPDYIETIDKQYSDMLSTKKEDTGLHNKGTYINLNGLMANLLDQTEVNERFKLKSGYLASHSLSIQTSILDEVSENMIRIHKKQEEKGKHFLFVLAPSNMYEHERLLPVGYNDTSNERIHYLLELLDQNGVAYLDLREKMREDAITNEEAFFITDHHWKPQTGFWAYTKILDNLAQRGVISPVDEFFTDERNYLFEIYEDAFLGSSGKRTGRYFAGVDDFCVISPKYETNLSIQVPDSKVDLQGRWENISYKGGDIARFLADPDYFNDNPYGRYGQGDVALTHWRNDSAPEDMKLLMIGDSFANVPYSFLPLYISQCDEMDMRYFEGDFTAHYESFDPDVVIVMVNLNSIRTVNTLYPYFAEAETEK